MPRRATKAYSYLRFSTPEQQRGDSFRRQTTAAREFATRHGLDLDESLSFEDLGISAYHGKNAAVGRLGAFLEAAKAGAIPQGSFLLVESLDRISRDGVRKAMRVLEDICGAGMKVATLMDGKVYDEKALDDPIGLIMSILLFARANEESATKARRLQAAWNNKRNQLDEGHVLTSLCPAWVELDRDAGKFKPVPEKVRVVKRIFKMALAGTGQNAIAEKLNRDKVPTFGRATYWQRSYIAKILSNPATVGTFIPHTMEHEDGRKIRRPQKLIAGYFPAAISAAQYDAVQALRSNLGASQRGRHATKPLSNIFAGLACCPACQGRMTLKNKGGDYRYLVCVRAVVEGGCKQARVRYNKVEAAFLSGVDEAMEECPSDDEAAKKLRKEVRNLDAGIDSALEQMEELGVKAGYGKLGTAHTINDRLVKLEHGVSQMRIDRDRLDEKAESLTGAVLKKRLRTLTAALEAKPLDRGAVNTTLRPLLSSIEIDYRSGYLYLNWKHGGEPGAIVYDGGAIFGAAT